MAGSGQDEKTNESRRDVTQAADQRGAAALQEKDQSREPSLEEGRVEDDARSTQTHSGASQPADADADADEAPATLSRTLSNPPPPVPVPRDRRRGLCGRFTVVAEVEIPKHYARGTKWFITFVIAIAAMAAPMGSAIFLRLSHSLTYSAFVSGPC